MWEWVATAVAVLAAGAAVWQAAEARTARTGAKEASASAADAAARMAAALEEQTALAREAATKYENPWSYVRQKHGQGMASWVYTLGGDETIEHVKWHVEPSDRHFGVDTPMPETMHPGDAVRFSWVRTGGSPTALTLEVTWQRPGDETVHQSRTTLMTS